MMIDSRYCHCVTALVAVPAGRAFEYLADPVALGHWSLGCMQTQPTRDGQVYAGRSLFNGETNCVAIEAQPALLLIDYRTGTPGGRLAARISARVVPAETCSLPDDHCYVTLTAWRSPEVSDDRWRQLCAAHEAEIWLIKAQLESGGHDRAALPAP